MVWLRTRTVNNLVNLWEIFGLAEIQWRYRIIMPTMMGTAKSKVGSDKMTRTTR
jgi:hypothetical protein